MTEYWNSLKRNFFIILFISALVALLALYIVNRQGVSYEAHFSYLVSLQQRDEVEDYRFDGFYALEATNLFSSTLAALIVTPEIISAAYREAGFELETLDPRQVTKSVAARKTAPQLVEVSVKHTSEDGALSLAQALQEVTVRAIDDYQEQGIPAVVFKAVPGEVWIGRTHLSIPVIVTAAFLFTFFFCINILLLSASVKRIND